MALFGPINPEPQQNMLKGMMNTQELQKAYLANALAQIQNKYAPQQQQSEIDLKQGQAFENRGRGTNYFAEATTAPSKIGLNNAQAGHMNALTKFMPEELQLKKDQLKHQQARFGSAYNFSKALSSLSGPARAKYIADHQDEYDNMLSVYGTQAMQDGIANATSQAPINALSPSPSPAPINNPATPQGVPTGNALTTLPTQANAPAAVPVNGTAPQGFSRSTPEQLASIKKAGDMYANKALTTAATERQMEGAIQIENIVNDPMVQQQVIDASQYAGAVRKGKAAIDAISQQNPAAYENYISFKNQTMPLMENRIRTLDTMGVQIKSIEKLEGMYSKTMDSLTSNPAQFITQFNKLAEALDTVSRSVQKSASPVSDVNRLNGYKPIPDQTGSVSVVSPDGRTGSIPASQLQEALKAGYKQG